MNHRAFVFGGVQSLKMSAVLVLLTGLALLTGCGEVKEEDPRTTSVTVMGVEVKHSYTNPEHMSLWSFACFVADEIWFLHNGYDCSLENDGITLFITNPATGLRLGVDAITLQEEYTKKGGKVAAEELLARAARELGPPPPRRENADPLGPELWMVHGIAQKERYPELYKQQVVYSANQKVMEARSEWQKGNREDAAQLVFDAATELWKEFGSADTRTQGAVLAYYQMTGEVICAEETREWLSYTTVSAKDARAKGIPIPGEGLASSQASAIPETAPENASELAAADAAIASASAKWRSGDVPGALAEAQKAYDVRARVLGPNGPNTLEVKAMAEKAGAASGKQ
ncbi:hypothetical protein HZA57_05705 [Candidatus Poribacteria bacterium]|nr:hypothetical protein [Candidatus Poribacteria bacterium]